MDLLIEILNKVLWFAFFMASLNVLRHAYNLIQTYMASEDNENAKYLLLPSELLMLGVSIAFIAMSIFSGIVL